MVVCIVMVALDGRCVSVTHVCVFMRWQPNLTRRATIGVAELYTRIRNSTARQGTGHAPSYIVTAASGGGSGGVDVVASQLSVMVARYKCVEHIADGTFSQIFRCVGHLGGLVRVHR